MLEDLVAAAFNAAVRKAEETLKAVFDSLNRKSRTPRDDVFAEITDADIDNLFND